MEDLWKPWLAAPLVLGGIHQDIALTSLGGRGKGLSLHGGNRTSTLKAFRWSMQGYRVAFPEEMASQGIFSALESATARCTEAFALDLGGAREQEILDMRIELHATILESLTQEAIEVGV